MVLRLPLFLLLAGCAAKLPAPRVMVDDFESGQARWKDAGSGAVRTTVTLVDGSVGGRRAAHIDIKSTGGEGWSDLTWPVDGWPVGATHISVWLRAATPCQVMIKVNLGPGHDDLEMWGCAVNVTTEWREVRVAVAELTQFIWGHKHGAAVEPPRITGIGFAEYKLTASFEVDRIAIE